MTISLLALASLLTVNSPSVTLAQAAELENAARVVGTFSNGFRYVQVAQDGDRVCVAAFFDAAGQAEALNLTVAEIRGEAAAALAELDEVLALQIEERRQGILALLADDELLNFAIANDQLTPEQAEQIEGFRNDPAALDAFLDGQAEDARQAARDEIEERRVAVEAEITTTADNAANFPAFEGIVSVTPATPLAIFATAEADMIVLPQENGLLLSGAPTRLVSYGPVDESAQDFPNRLNSDAMQACLSAQEPFRVEF